MNKNYEGKRTARERLQEQRENDKAREKRKRTLIAVGAVVAVLAIAGGVAAIVAGHNSGGSGGAAVATPAGATGSGKLAILSGAADAPSTLTVYEDFRCPACDAFENGYRSTVHGLEDSGQVKVEYHLVRLIDGNLGGTGSLNAANAAACAQDQGKFRPFHDVLYENQPEESADKFADKAYLLRLAAKVPGLTTPAFTACVNSGTYDAWVKKSAAAFNTSGFNSTPTILLNGTNIYADQNNPLTPAKLKAKVAAANRGKKPGTVTATATPSRSAAASSGSVPSAGSATASASG